MHHCDARIRSYDQGRSVEPDLPAPNSTSLVLPFRETGFTSKYRRKGLCESFAERICVRFSTASSKAGLAAKTRSHKRPASTDA